MPYKQGPFPPSDRSEASPPQAGPLLNRRPGYIRYVDINHLIALAQTYRISVHLERRVGQFVPAGVPLAHVSRPDVPADRALILTLWREFGAKTKKAPSGVFFVLEQ